MPVAITDIIRNLGTVLRYRYAGDDARNRAKNQLEHIVRTGDAEARKQAELELTSNDVVKYERSGVMIRKTN